ncbi:hypothetical protein HZA42_00275 [Candidatus Peregrinibacteria bacterium]|nr:hypothetical protein [Candidatus Peregrinibacteria bacterium]
MTKARRLFHTARGVLFVALVLVTGFGALSSVYAATTSSTTGTRVSLPDSSTNTDGTVRSITRDVNVDFGVDIGPNIPSGAPGSSATQPLPKFSGINAPVWINSTGPVQVGDDMIVYGITDVRNGLVNNGPNAGAAAAAAGETLTVNAYPAGNTAKKYLSSAGAPLGSIGGFSFSSVYNKNVKITQLVLAKSGTTPNANITRVSVVVTNNGQVLGAASSTSIANQTAFTFSPAPIIPANAGDVHFDFFATANAGNGTDFTMTVNSIAASTVAASASIPIYGMPYQMNTTFVNANGLPPAPAITLTAPVGNQKAGTQITLTWSATDADSCAAASPANWTALTGTSGVSATITTPVATTDYTIRCIGPGGSTTGSATVTVTPAPTVTMTASSNKITVGDTVNLTWTWANIESCPGSATSTTSDAITSITSNLSIATPPLGRTTYSITCRNAAGATATSSVTVEAIAAPTIVNFTATPASIPSGAQTMLNWNVQNADAGCSITSSSAGYISNAVSGSVTLSPTTKTTYTLSCINTANTRIVTDKVVTVTAPPRLTFTNLQSSSVQSFSAPDSTGWSTNQLLLNATANSNTNDKPHVDYILIKYEGNETDRNRFANFSLRKGNVTTAIGKFEGWKNMGSAAAPRWTLKFSFSPAQSYSTGTIASYQLYGDIACGTVSPFAFILDQFDDIHYTDPPATISGLPFTKQYRSFRTCPSSGLFPIKPPTIPLLINFNAPEPAPTETAGFFEPFIQTARAEFIPTAYAQAAALSRPPYNPVTVLDNLYIQGGGAAANEPGNLYVEGYLQNVNGALLINDDTNIAGFLNADGSMAIGENLQVWNNLQVLGNTSMAALTVANGATVNGASTIAGVQLNTNNITTTGTLSADAGITTKANLATSNAGNTTGVTIGANGDISATGSNGSFLITTSDGSGNGEMPGFKMTGVDDYVTTLSAAINNAVSTITVAGNNYILPGKTIIIDSEKMLVLSKSGSNTLYVSRGSSGTSAAAHVAGATINKSIFTSLYNGNFTTSGKITSNAIGGFYMVKALSNTPNLTSLSAYCSSNDSLVSCNGTADPGNSYMGTVVEKSSSQKRCSVIAASPNSYITVQAICFDPEGSAPANVPTPTSGTAGSGYTSAQVTATIEQW